VGGFTLMATSDLKKVAPLWLNYTVAVRYDPDVRPHPTPPGTPVLHHCLPAGLFYSLLGQARAGTAPRELTQGKVLLRCTEIHGLRFILALLKNMKKVTDHQPTKVIHILWAGVNMLRKSTIIS
jgi:hypothetical protein